MPSETVTPQPALGAEDVDGRRLLPEGALGPHHHRPRGRKDHAFDKSGGVTDDVVQRAGFTRGPGAKLQHDRRRHIAGAGSQRFVFDKDLLAFEPKPRGRSVDRKPGLEGWQDVILHPLREALADRLGPAPLLAAGRGQGVAGLSHQVRRERADVIGKIDVFGEPPDHAVGLRERCSPLEDQMLAKRRGEQGVERPDDPDILL